MNEPITEIVTRSFNQDIVGSLADTEMGYIVPKGTRSMPK